MASTKTTPQPKSKQASPRQAGQPPKAALPKQRLQQWWEPLLGTAFAKRVLASKAPKALQAQGPFASPNFVWSIQLFTVSASSASWA